MPTRPDQFASLTGFLRRGTEKSKQGGTHLESGAGVGAEPVLDAQEEWPSEGARGFSVGESIVVMRSQRRAAPA